MVHCYFKAPICATEQQKPGKVEVFNSVNLVDKNCDEKNSPLHFYDKDETTPSMLCP